MFSNICQMGDSFACSFRKVWTNIIFKRNKSLRGASIASITLLKEFTAIITPWNGSFLVRHASAAYIRIHVQMHLKALEIEIPHVTYWEIFRFDPAPIRLQERLRRRWVRDKKTWRVWKSSVFMRLAPKNQCMALEGWYGTHGLWHFIFLRLTHLCIQKPT